MLTISATQATFHYTDTVVQTATKYTVNQYVVDYLSTAMYRVKCIVYLPPIPPTVCQGTCINSFRCCLKMAVYGLSVFMPRVPWSADDTGLDGHQQCPPFDVRK